MICWNYRKFFIPNTKTIWYGISTASNALSEIGHTSTIIESKEIINELNDVLERAKKQKEEIKTQINNFIKILLDIEKGQFPKFEESQMIENNL